MQPPDAENRTSGGVGGVTGAIPSPPPDIKEEGDLRAIKFKTYTVRASNVVSLI